MGIVSYGEITITDISGNIVDTSKTKIQYYLSTSATSLSGGSWSDTPPKAQDGKFFWQKYIQTMNDGSIQESDPVCITGAKGTSVTHVMRYYRLTSSAPAKPTATTPSGWTTTEPSYTDGSTDSLYFVDRFTFSDGTFTYSDVSKSTSYEAAKQAYALAKTAKETSDANTQKISGVETKVDAAQKSITDKVWESDITTKIDDLNNTTIKSISDKVAEHTQTIDGFETKVSNVETKVDNNNTTLTDRISKAEQDLSGFKQTVSQTYATSDSVSTMRSEIDQTTSSISTRVESAQSSANSANSKIDGLKIGGRNLLLDSAFNNPLNDKGNSSSIIKYNSDFAIVDTHCISGTKGIKVKTANNTNTGFYIFIPKEPIGSKYVFSFYGNDLGSLSVYSPNNPLSYNVVKIDDNWNRYVVNITIQSNYGYLYIRPTGNSTTVGSEFLVNAPQLEEGTVATAWTPAPEDLESSISTISQKADSIEAKVTTNTGNISSLTTKASGLESRVSTAEGNISTVTQKASSLESRMGTAEGNISTVTQKASSLESRMKSAEGNVSSLQQSVSGFETKVSNAQGAANTAVSTANSTKQKLESMQIGGRNLCKGTSNVLTQLDFTSTTVTEGKQLATRNKPNIFDITKYTGVQLTMRVWIEDANLPVRLHACGESFGTVLGNIITGSGYSTLTFTVPQTVTGNWNVYVGYDSKAKFKYSKFKIEEGNVATLWTPAPEDIKVGGRNLYCLNKFSNLYKSNTSDYSANMITGDITLIANGADLYIGEILAAGQLWTERISPLMPVEEGTTIVFNISNPLFTKNFYNFLDENRKAISGYASFSTTNGVISVPTGAKYLTMRFGYGGATSGTSYSFKIKVEVGEISTDWSPAPEDLESMVITSRAETEQKANEFTRKMLTDYTSKTDFNAYKTTVSSQFSQTDKNISMRFDESIKKTDDLSTDVYNKFNTYSTYFNFTGNGLEVGKDGNPLKLNMTNDRIQFKNNGKEIGYWDGVNFHTGNIMVDVQQEAGFGNFSFIPRDDGSLSLMRVREFGRNLIRYSKEYNGAKYSGWVDNNNGTSITSAPYTYVNGFGVQRIVSAWWDISQNVDVIPDTLYTYSAYIKFESSHTGHINFYGAKTNDDNQVCNPNSLTVTDQVGTSDYQRVSVTVRTGKNQTKWHGRFEATKNEPYLIYGLKLEVGDKATPWSPAWED